MQILTFNSFKGGPGKSTFTILFTNFLKATGKKVLIWDIDIVNHTLSYFFDTGLPESEIYYKNAYNILSGNSNIKDNIIEISDNINLIHGSTKVKEIQDNDCTEYIKKAIKEIESDYDYLLVDTCPIINEITKSFFQVSQKLIIPVLFSTPCYQSTKHHIETLLELNLSSLDVQMICNQYQKPRTDNKESYTNQIQELFKSDETLSHFLISPKLSRSRTIEKYIDSPGYSITDRLETRKQMEEITSIINTVLSTNYTIERL